MLRLLWKYLTDSAASPLQKVRVRIRAKIKVRVGLASRGRSG